MKNNRQRPDTNSVNHLKLDIDADMESLILFSEGRIDEFSREKKDELMEKIARSAEYRDLLIGLKSMHENIAEHSPNMDLHTTKRDRIIGGGGFTKYNFRLVRFGLSAAACLMIGICLWHISDREERKTGHERPEIVNLRYDPLEGYSGTNYRSTWLTSRNVVVSEPPTKWDRQMTFNMGEENKELEVLIEMAERTVIIIDQKGHGSGVFISADGMILTNYHVVENAIQRAALQGTQSQLDILTCVYNEETGQLRKREKNGKTVVLKASPLRVDPLKDIALLKLIEVPDFPIHFAPLYQQNIHLKTRCVAIGSPGGKPAWHFSESQISSKFIFPTEFTEYTVEEIHNSTTGSAKTRQILEDTQGLWLATGCSISPGDSGGPLFNKQGELIGLNVAVSCNEVGGKTGYHISVDELNAFMNTLDGEVSPVPVDLWKAGNTDGRLLMPKLSIIRVNEDQAIHGLTLIFDLAPPEVFFASPSAICFYYQFDQFHPDNTIAEDFEYLIPYGLWGRLKGKFRFDIALVLRNDGISMAGYTDPDKRLNQIRIDRDGDGLTDVAWICCSKGKWGLADDKIGNPLIETNDETQNAYAEAILREIRDALSQ